ncbi:hypothetical protein AgCh_021781 [Apium graveolens]
MIWLQENGLLHVPKGQAASNPQAQMFSDPNMAMDMMKKNLSMIIPEVLSQSVWFKRFRDPGPHGRGRYSEHMLPEVEKKDFYKGAQVHYKFELMQETLYLTMNLIDRLLAIQPVVQKKLQLVEITALLLACKYEEAAVSVVEDLIMISDRVYNRREVLEMVI